MNSCKEGPTQCEACLKFFRTKQTYSLHIVKCSEAKSEEKRAENVENSKIEQEQHSEVKRQPNLEIEKEKSVDELEKEIEQLQEEIEKEECGTKKQENVDVKDEDIADVSKSILDDINMFMKSNDAELEFSDQSDKNPHDYEEKPEINATEGICSSLPNVSMESIEIEDDEEEDKIVERSDISIDLTEEEPEDKEILVSVDPVDKKPKKPKKKGRVPFKPKPCSYCDVQCHDRIGLAKHLISDHWETVRIAQGGGKLDRSAYYKQIQDSRIIRPSPPAMSARTSFHMKGLAGADAVNQIYQNRNVNVNPKLQNKNPAWLQKLESSFTGGTKPNFAKGMDMSQSQSQMSLKQLDNFKKYNEQKRNLYLLNKRNRNPHSPAWFGNPPNRKRNILPKPSPGEVLDLTADDEPTCDICEDDFNWPDENHACPLKQSKKMKMEQPNNTTASKKGGLTLLKEKIFKALPEEKGNSIIPTDKKKQQLEASVKRIPSSTKIIPLNNSSSKTPTRVMPARNMPKRTMPSRTLPLRNMPTRTMPERTMATRTMPSRRVKTY